MVEEVEWGFISGSGHVGEVGGEGPVHGLAAEDSDGVGFEEVGEGPSAEEGPGFDWRCQDEGAVGPGLGESRGCEVWQTGDLVSRWDVLRVG